LGIREILKVFGGLREAKVTVHTQAEEKELQQCIQMRTNVVLEGAYFRLFFPSII
jgi:hypothetical protein